MIHLEPIDDLINESIRLSNKPVENKDKLEEIREIIIRQKQLINKYNYKELEKKMKDYNTPSDEYYEYLELYEIYKKYEEKNDIIYLIENKKYTKLSSIYNRKIKKYKIAGIVAGGSLIITLCTAKILNGINNKNYTVGEKAAESTVSHNYEDHSVETKTEKIVNETINNNSAEKVENKVEDKTERITEVKNNDDEQRISEAEQRTIVDLFKDMNDDTLNGDGSKEAKSRAKGFVVNTIDFIFFNSSINGITFNDLKDEFKQEIYDYLKNMDRVVMSFDPDYKETLGEKYNAIKDYAKEKLDAAKNIVINHLGEERYNAIISKKNEIMDNIKEGFKKYGGKALKYIKEKYLEWKEE